MKHKERNLIECPRNAYGNLLLGQMNLYPRSGELLQDFAGRLAMACGIIDEDNGRTLSIIWRRVLDIILESNKERGIRGVYFSRLSRIMEAMSHLS